MIQLKSPRRTTPRAATNGRVPVAATRRRPQEGLKFARVFSQKTIAPFDEIEWEHRTAEITDDSGKAIFKQESVEVPKSWSALATKIAVSKYFYGDIANGTDPYKGGRECSVRQLVHRVTRTITDCGIKDGYFADQESAEIFYNELTWLCVNQHGAFNSPVWFNVGLWHQYHTGEGRGEGNYFYNHKTGQAQRAATQYEYPQGSACFIQSVDDNMEDIMRLAMSEAMLFKYGSGTGSDLSTLRSTREKLSGGGRPSGPLSFLKVYDQVANVVKSGGKTRRAAKMNTLKDWHPDIEEFIEAKTKEEKKAWALIEQGYDGSYNGDAYGSIMYQNENLSVRVSDEFMNAAVEGKEWWTKRVTDGKPCEKKEAKALLRKIAEGTHLCGDPGVQFDTTIDKWHTCKGTGRQNSTNPCSEYLFLDNTACNLASLNLLKFKKADGGFDVERFKAAVRVFITAQEIIVDNASYPIKEIAENSHIFRTLGLGYANLGALIMSYGLGYDTDEGRALAGAITSIMTGHAYEQSAKLAKTMGPFPGYKDTRASGVKKTVDSTNESYMLEVIDLHRSHVSRIQDSDRFGYLKEEAQKCWDGALAQGKKHGYRNAQVTVLAPTGTIGFLMDCDTTGIEPDIALVKYKLLAGGGMLKIVNQTVKPALQNLGYSFAEIEGVVAHIDKFDTIEDVTDEDGTTIPSGLKPEHLPVFDCAFKPHRGSRSLHYRGHIRMMAAAQPFLSGAISKTVNLPEEATVEDIVNTYVEGWQLGLKAIAIYRDGSKRSAPLNVKKTKDMGTAEAVSDVDAVLNDKRTLEARIVELEQEAATLRAKCDEPIRRRMPETRLAMNHKFEIAGHKGYLTVGMFEDGQPGELFIQMNKEGSTIGGLMDTVATLTSISLQYGVPLESLVKKFAYQRFEPSGFTKNPDIRNATSITDYIFRWLGCQFIKGYKEATSPNKGQVDLPMRELAQIDKAALNRPVPELPRDSVDIIDVVTNTNGSEGSPHIKAPGNTHAERVQEALGNMYMDTPCSNCGSSKVIRAGACGCCTECGTSQGCS
ncbi:ribonucleoside-diphosphate reductase, adenosylcobalamin-dependent [Chthoniobacter flavus Ellin428]|uniref:Vitamin B12-dependent ribonucleotide reductase n=1 Tax=Chthoniobacter flavus Ellin428 TaxID=497964 RepID=B4D0S2_9BACT|nr:vitamin B12-dependent ribonucleotide reductase [Chthoniobacter flavus]EDY19934.1 ribonucleoside-diphosphate reductase, adenosylcobalamin-dependent [Chthoniobacter flavus Ellin428]TCO91795.1 ribonucleoside-diphosphate reductase class II [Chthoniobacter flavus]